MATRNRSETRQFGAERPGARTSERVSAVGARLLLRSARSSLRLSLLSEIALQASHADSEDLGGAGAVPGILLQGAEDGLPFDVLHAAGGHGRRGTRRGGLSAAIVL